MANKSVRPCCFYFTNSFYNEGQIGFQMIPISPEVFRWKKYQIVNKEILFK